MDWTDCIDSSQPATIQCAEFLIANLIRAVVGLGVLALFVMFLIGGFTFLTSAGDAKKAEKARNTMLWAVVGAVIMVAVYALMKALEKFTGVNLLKFTIPT